MSTTARKHKCKAFTTMRRTFTRLEVSDIYCALKSAQRRVEESMDCAQRIEESERLRDLAEDFLVSSASVGDIALSWVKFTPEAENEVPA